MENSTDKKADIFKVMALTHIPEINRIAAQFITKFEKKRMNRMTDLQAKKKAYYMSLFSDQQQRKGSGFYWFELTRYKEGQWRMRHIEPDPGDAMTRYTILPKDVIDDLYDVIVDPDTVITRKNLRSKSVGKTVDLQLVKYSPHHLFGTIHERRKGNKKEIDSTGVMHPEEDMESYYRKFYHNMRLYPEAHRDFILRFLSDTFPGFQCDAAVAVK